MTALASDPAVVAPARAGAYRLTFGRLLRSEAIKLTTLRSTWWTLGIAAALSVGISLMIASASGSFPPGFPAVNTILMPTQFTMLVAGILGAIVITGEYSTGMIRSTLAAQPRRGAVLAAKAVVVSLLMAATTIVSYIVAVLATAPLLQTGIAWGDPEQSIIPLAFGVLAMIVFTLIGLGFGFLIRSGARAIAATVGVLFVLPIVFSLFTIAGEGWQWLVDAARFLPMNAAATLQGATGSDIVEPLLTLLAWAVVPLVAGWAVLKTRDA